LLQSLLHQLQRPSLLVGNVRPRVSCHQKKCSREPNSPGAVGWWAHFTRHLVPKRGTQSAKCPCH
jgi:hypothetical protein